MLHAAWCLAGTRVRGRGYADTGTGGGYGYAGKRVRIQWVFFQKKTDRPFSNPYPFTRLYPGTGTGTAGMDRGYTATGCTRRVLANH
jgi:hypothetical protein